MSMVIRKAECVVRENINVNVVKTEAKQHVECGVVVIKQASGNMQMKVLTKFRLTDFGESDENADAKQKPDGGGAEQACVVKKRSRARSSEVHNTKKKKYCAGRGSNASCKFVNERKAVA